MTIQEKFKKLFLNITEKEYREIDAVSYSALSNFAKNGPISLIAKRKEVAAFRMGNLVETLLFEPETFDDKFVIFDGREPTASSLELAKGLISSGDVYTPENIESVLEVIKQLNLWGSTKDSNKLIAKFNNYNFWGYLEANYKANNGCVIIDSYTALIAQQKVEALKTNNFTAGLFDEEVLNDSFIQAQGLIEINEIPVKFMLDIITIDFENKIIYPRDLKTGKELAEEFDRNFYAYKYYLQGGLYSRGLKELIKGTEFEEYTIAPFEFIYINNAKQNSPIIKRMGEGWNELAANGWENSFGYKSGWENSFGYKSMGYLELMELYTWHKINEEYNYSKETVENNGVSIIKKPV